MLNSMNLKMSRFSTPNGFKYYFLDLQNIDDQGHVESNVQIFANMSNIKKIRLGGL